MTSWVHINQLSCGSWFGLISHKGYIVSIKLWEKSIHLFFSSISGQNLVNSITQTILWGRLKHLLFQPVTRIPKFCDLGSYTLSFSFCFSNISFNGLSESSRANSSSKRSRPESWHTHTFQRCFSSITVCSTKSCIHGIYFNYH